MRLVLATHAAALACLVVAYLQRDDVRIEGAYFDRAVGSPAAVAAVSHDGSTVWIVAAAVLVAAGAVLVLVQDRRRRRPA